MYNNEINFFMFCMSELLISVNLLCFYQLHAAAVTVTAHLYICTAQVEYCVTKTSWKLSTRVNIKNIITSLFWNTVELYIYKPQVTLTKTTDFSSSNTKYNQETGKNP
jgi:ascorbate-specific PTS system EIIC-type component UlaA